MALRDKTKDWYEGEYVFYENKPDSPFFVVGGYYVRHWTARAARRLIEFWLDNWKWCIGFLVSLAALTLAYLRL